MSTNKTQPTSASVLDYINALEHPKRKADALKLYAIFNNIMPEPAVLWGESLIGYGSYHYKYKSGREGDFFLTGFSPRTQNLSIYIIPGFAKYKHLLDQLGKHKSIGIFMKFSFSAVFAIAYKHLNQQLGLR